LTEGRAGRSIGLEGPTGKEEKEKRDKEEGGENGLPSFSMSTSFTKVDLFYKPSPDDKAPTKTEII